MHFPCPSEVGHRNNPKHSYTKTKTWIRCLPIVHQNYVVRCFLCALNYGQSSKSLSNTFAWLSVGQSTDPNEVNIFYISPLQSLNLVLIACAKLNGHWGTWTGCLKIIKILFWDSYILGIAPIMFDI